MLSPDTPTASSTAAPPSTTIPRPTLTLPSPLSSSTRRSGRRDGGTNGQSVDSRPSGSIGSTGFLMDNFTITSFESSAVPTTHLGMSSRITSHRRALSPSSSSSLQAAASSGGDTDGWTKGAASSKRERSEMKNGTSAPRSLCPPDSLRDEPEQVLPSAASCEITPVPALTVPYDAVSVRSGLSGPRAQPAPLHRLPSSSIAQEPTWVPYPTYLRLSAPLLKDRDLQDRVAVLCCHWSTPAGEAAHLICLDEVLPFFLYGGLVSPPVAAIPSPSGKTSALGEHPFNGAGSNGSTMEEAERVAFPLFCLLGPKRCTLSLHNSAVRSIHAVTQPLTHDQALHPCLDREEQDAQTTDDLSSSSAAACRQRWRRHVLVLFAEQLFKALPVFPTDLLYTTHPDGHEVAAPPTWAASHWNSWRNTPKAVQQGQPYDNIWSVVTLRRLTMMLRRWEKSAASVMRRLSSHTDTRTTERAGSPSQSASPTSLNRLCEISGSNQRERYSSVPSAASPSALQGDTDTERAPGASECSSSGCPATAGAVASTIAASAPQATRLSGTWSASAVTSSLDSSSGRIQDGMLASSAVAANDGVAHPYDESLAVDPTTLVDTEGHSLYGAVHRYDVPSPPRPGSSGRWAFARSSVESSLSRAVTGRGGDVTAGRRLDRRDWLSASSLPPRAPASAPERDGATPRSSYHGVLLPAQTPLRPASASFVHRAMGRTPPIPAASHPYDVAAGLCIPTNRTGLVNGHAHRHRKSTHRVRRHTDVQEGNTPQRERKGKDGVHGAPRNGNVEKRRAADAKQIAPHASSANQRGGDARRGSTEVSSSRSGSVGSNNQSAGLQPTPPSTIPSRAQRRSKDVNVFLQNLLAAAERRRSLDSTATATSTTNSDTAPPHAYNQRASDALYVASAGPEADRETALEENSATETMLQDTKRGREERSEHRPTPAEPSACPSATIPSSVRRSTGVQYVPTPPAGAHSQHSFTHSRLLPSMDTTALSHSDVGWVTEEATPNANGGDRKTDAAPVQSLFNTASLLMHTTHPSLSSSSASSLRTADMVSSMMTSTSRLTSVSQFDHTSPAPDPAVLGVAPAEISSREEGQRRQSVHSSATTRSAEMHLSAQHVCSNNVNSSADRGAPNGAEDEQKEKRQAAAHVVARIHNHHGNESTTVHAETSTTADAAAELVLERSPSAEEKDSPGVAVEDEGTETPFAAHGEMTASANQTAAVAPAELAPPSPSTPRPPPLEGGKVFLAHALHAAEDGHVVIPSTSVLESKEAVGCRRIPAPPSRPGSPIPMPVLGSSVVSPTPATAAPSVRDQLWTLVVRIVQAVGRGYLNRRRLYAFHPIPSLASSSMLHQRANGAAASAVREPVLTVSFVSPQALSRPPPLTAFIVPESPSTLQSPVAHPAFSSPVAQVATTSPALDVNTFSSRVIASTASLGQSASHTSTTDGSSPKQRLLTIYTKTGGSALENSSSSCLPMPSGQNAATATYTACYNEPMALESKAEQVPLQLSLLEHADHSECTGSLLSTALSRDDSQYGREGMTSTHTLPPSGEERRSRSFRSDSSPAERASRPLTMEDGRDAGREREKVVERKAPISPADADKRQHGKSMPVWPGAARGIDSATPAAATTVSVLPSLMKPLSIQAVDARSDLAASAILKESMDDWHNRLQSRANASASCTIAFLEQTAHGPLHGSVLSMSEDTGSPTTQSTMTEQPPQPTTPKMTSAYARTGAVAMLRVQRIGRGYLARLALARQRDEQHEEDDLDLLLQRVVLKAPAAAAVASLTSPMADLEWAGDEFVEEVEEEEEDETTATTGPRPAVPVQLVRSASLESPTVSDSPICSLSGRGAPRAEQSPPFSYLAPVFPPFHALPTNAVLTSQFSGSAYAPEGAGQDEASLRSSGGAGGGVEAGSAIQRSATAAALVTPEGSFRYLMPAALTPPFSHGTPRRTRRTFSGQGRQGSLLLSSEAVEKVGSGSGFSQSPAEGPATTPLLAAGQPPPSEEAPTMLTPTSVRRNSPSPSSWRAPFFREAFPVSPTMNITPAAGAVVSFADSAGGDAGQGLNVRSWEGGAAVQRPRRSPPPPSPSAQRVEAPVIASAAAGTSMSPLEGSLFAASSRSGRSMNSGASLPFELSTTAHTASAMLHGDDLFSMRSGMSVTPPNWALDEAPIMDETYSHMEAEDSPSDGEESVVGDVDAVEEDVPVDVVDGGSSDEDEAAAFARDLQHLQLRTTDLRFFDSAAHLPRSEAAPLAPSAALALMQRAGRGYLQRSELHFHALVSVSWSELVLVHRVVAGYQARQALGLDYCVTEMAKAEMASWDRRNAAAVKIKAVLWGFFDRQRVQRMQRKLLTRMELRIARERFDAED